jgi:hypothetical protein
MAYHAEKSKFLRSRLGDTMSALTYIHAPPICYLTVVFGSFAGCKSDMKELDALAPIVLRNPNGYSKNWAISCRVAQLSQYLYTYLANLFFSTSFLSTLWLILPLSPLSVVSMSQSYYIFSWHPVPTLQYPPTSRSFLSHFPHETTLLAQSSSITIPPALSPPQPSSSKQDNRWER